jgi:hypothetical protein
MPPIRGGVRIIVAMVSAAVGSWMRRVYVPQVSFPSAAFRQLPPLCAAPTQRTDLTQRLRHGLRPCGPPRRALRSWAVSRGRRPTAGPHPPRCGSAGLRLQWKPQLAALVASVTTSFLVPARTAKIVHFTVSSSTQGPPAIFRLFSGRQLQRPDFRPGILSIKPANILAGVRPEPGDMRSRHA